jgi:predicted ATPase/DNA-binding CsgD family transcriptional regulator
VAQLRQYLRSKSLLLVLDNMEHLLSGTPFLVDMLQSAPALKVLTTTRDRLHLRGEWSVVLDGLPFPVEPQPQDSALRMEERDAAAAVARSPKSDPEQYAAVRLFVQTSQRYRPDFMLDDENTADIARICRLVDGLPLGIELAAGWTRVLSCSEIADEIARSLDFLITSGADLPARQRSLRAVFDYSWALLSAPEQRALSQLAVMRGSFTREAAEAVVKTDMPGRSDVFLLNLLASWVDKSLLHHVVFPDGGRYELLDLLRQYAAEHLESASELAAVSARHAAYYAGLLSAQTPDLCGAGQQRALVRLGAEIDQLRAAWRWASEQADSALLERAAIGLFHFYDMQSWFREGAAMFATARLALEDRSGDQHVRAFGIMLAREGWFTFQLGRQLDARTLLQRSVAVLRAVDARAELVFSLSYFGMVCAYLGDYTTTDAACQEGLALARELGDLYGQAVASNMLGQAAYDLGDYSAAQAWSQQSLAIEQRIGNRWSMTFSLTNLGKVAYVTGAYAEARWFFEESLQIRKQLSDTRGVAICLNRLGNTAAALGAYDDASQHYDQSLRLFRSIGNRWGIADVLINFGELALARQQLRAALPVFQEALRLASEIGSLRQIVKILGACAPLARAGGDAAWAAELTQLSGEPPDSIEQYRRHVERLLAWPGNQPPAVLTLEQALATLRAPAASGPRAEQAATQSQPRLSPSFPGGLTAREVDVLRLVAEGLTDIQVADKLVISPRTVQAHLSSIYGKLQISSRSAATRFAVEQGLV